MSSSKDVKIETKSGRTVEIGTNHLLLIAVNKYHKSIPSLNNPVRDVQAVKLAILENYYFDKENCIELFDEAATRHSIMKTFDELTLKLTASDNLIIYFAGHGEYYESRKEGYWILSDAILDRRETYLPDNEIFRFIQSLKSKHVFTLIDSCFSGGFFRGTKMEMSRAYDIKSRFVATSGRIEIVADGPPGHHSPFCNAFLQQLRLTEKKVNWVSEMCLKVRELVSEYGEDQLPRAERIRLLGDEGGEFAFIHKNMKARNIESKDKSIGDSASPVSLKKNSSIKANTVNINNVKGNVGRIDTKTNNKSS